MEESERQTRKKRIDVRLRGCGWKLAPFRPDTPPDKYLRHAVEEYPTENGPADYGLFCDGHVLGIIEAKRLSLGPQNVLGQAQRYAKGILARCLTV